MYKDLLPGDLFRFERDQGFAVFLMLHITRNKPYESWVEAWVLTPTGNVIVFKGFTVSRVALLSNNASG